MTIAGRLLCIGLAVPLAFAGCVLAGSGGSQVGSIRVMVDNAMDYAVLVRIEGRRIGEAAPNARTFLEVGRTGIAERYVTVCVDPPATPGALCHPGRLNVQGSVREIRIDVQRSGRVHASAL